MASVFDSKTEEIPGALLSQDIDFLKRKQQEVCEYFHLRTLLATNKEEFDRLAALWNWSLNLKKRFDTIRHSP